MSDTSQTIINATPAMRILKIASCPTCSAKGILTYQIGCKADNQISFRITGNTGGGYFSAEWVSLSSIQDALANAPQPVTSFAFSKLFQGKSTNTPAFLLAALLSEGLLKPIADKQRGYEILDSTAFMAEVSKLIASDVDLKSAPSITKSASPIKPKKSPV
jgi:hypothetical protein